MKQTALDFSPKPSYAAADFVVSDCNRLAKMHLDQWPKWQSYGSLFIGATSSGKTHLAHIWAAKSGAVIVHQATDIAHLALHHLVIDDADVWIAAHGEHALFHLLNQAKEHHRQILLTASTPPNQWKLALPDLISRLNSLTQIALNPPDESLLSAVMAKHFNDRQIKVEQGVIQYIVARQERSFSETRRIVMALDAMALEQQRPITLVLARQCLSNGD